MKSVPEIFHSIVRETVAFHFLTPVQEKGDAAHHPPFRGNGGRRLRAAAMSFFGLGGSGKEKGELTALKQEVAELQREREQLRTRCREFEEQQTRGPARSAAGDAAQTAVGEELQRFIDTTQISVFGVDLQGRVTAWNARVEALMGKRSKDVLGMTLYDVLSDSNETPVETRDEVRLQAQLPPSRGPMR